MDDAIFSGHFSHAGRSAALYLHWRRPAPNAPERPHITAVAEGRANLTFSHSLGGDRREKLLRSWLEAK